MTGDVDALLQWKAEAMVVLAEWDRVYVALGEPGELGTSKAIAALIEVRRLISRIGVEREETL